MRLGLEARSLNRACGTGVPVILQCGPERRWNFDGTAYVGPDADWRQHGPEHIHARRRPRVDGEHVSTRADIGDCYRHVELVVGAQRVAEIKLERAGGRVEADLVAHALRRASE